MSRPSSIYRDLVFRCTWLPTTRDLAISLGLQPGEEDSNVLLMRVRQLPTVFANSTTFGSSEGRSTVHLQNAAMRKARSMASFEVSKPDSMMGIRAAAALRRLISGVGGGICFDMPNF